MSTLEIQTKPSSSSQRDPMIGRKLLHYRVVEEIGQGGMSVVYKGSDETLDRLVAIKVLHPFLAQKGECRDRLNREARLVARLQHPNILKIFDYSEEESAIETAEGEEEKPEIFLISEFVDGVTLRTLAENVPIAEVPELGAMIVWQLALALHHAHQQGVIHRDLKPENIMVRQDGVLKLMDFGIARATESNRLTVTGTLLGSPAHMAPENLDGRTADERSDLFSLGTILYWLCTGQLPFDAPTPHALLKAISENKYAPPQHISPRIPDGLAQIITQCMAADPLTRFESAKGLADALDAYLSEWGLAPTVNGLCELLQSPQESLTTLNDQLKNNAMAQAETLLEQEQTGKALSKVSRVLAASPQDQQAQQLLEQIEAQGQKPRWQLIALTVFPLALVVGVILLFSWYPNPQDTQPKPVKTEPPTVVDDLGDIDNGKSLIPPPPKAASPIKAASSTKKAPKKNITKRRVAMRVNSFADIYVNGKKVAKNKRALTMKLPLGKHRLKFENQYASKVEKTVIVKSKGRIKPIEVNLDKMKPATLVVMGTPKDAIVGIGKNSKGTIAKSQKDPMKIPLPDKTPRWDMDVTIHKKGFIPKTVPVKFIAGKPTRLQVNLLPEATP